MINHGHSLADEDVCCDALSKGLVLIYIFLKQEGGSISKRARAALFNFRQPTDALLAMIDFPCIAEQNAL